MGVEYVVVKGFQSKTMQSSRGGKYGRQWSKIFILLTGPRPEALMANIDLPLLLLWGEKDPWTPANGPVWSFYCKFYSWLLLFALWWPPTRTKIGDLIICKLMLSPPSLWTGSKVLYEASRRAGQPLCGDTSWCWSLPSWWPTWACSWTYSSFPQHIWFVTWSSNLRVSEICSRYHYSFRDILGMRHFPMNFHLKMEILVE